MRIVLFDYGAGNLHSLAKALERSADIVVIDTDPARAAAECDLLVLPGVGAFGAATDRLAPGRDAMRGAIAAGLPTMGICLGMQLLFDSSDEGEGAGLGIIAGRVIRLNARRVPQIGWNTVESSGNDRLLEQAPLPIAYYANSYVCQPDDESSVIAWSSHESVRFPAAVRAGATVGVQFHPEKSSADGVRFLHTFIDDVRRGVAS